MNTHNDIHRQDGSLYRVLWSVALVVAGAYVAWLLYWLFIVYSNQRLLGSIWPLPGVFLVLVAIIAIAGWIGTLLYVIKRSRISKMLLISSGSLLMVLAIISFFSMGTFIFPLALLFLVLGVLGRRSQSPQSPSVAR